MDSEAGSPADSPFIGSLVRLLFDYLRSRMLTALHEHGHTELAATHLVILRYPSSHGRRPGQIARESGLSKQAANYLLSELERHGYLERRDDPDDRRSRRVFLTQRGFDAIDIVHTTLADFEATLAEDIGPREVERLRDLLVRSAGTVERLRTDRED